jgi:hypothetical protein
MDTQKKRERQGGLSYAGRLPTALGHPFYKRPNEVLETTPDLIRFARQLRHLLSRQAGTTIAGARSVLPRYDDRFLRRAHSERGIASRVADSLTLRQFLSMGLGENTPDHERFREPVSFYISESSLGRWSVRRRAG